MRQACSSFHLKQSEDEKLDALQDRLLDFNHLPVGYDAQLRRSEFPLTRACGAV
jgi:hypothetical protein